ncbi:MAG: hypothetical protein PVH77_09935 [Phycisphaerales bacterium]|jgi:hypothetical protein
MDEKLVTIKEFADYIEAELAKQKLDDFGIKSVVTGQNTAITYSIPAVGMVSLQTFESQAKQALEILESNKQQENDTEDKI